MTETAPSGPPPPVADAPTVLLVDDEPSVLSALRRLFRPHGYRILQATGGPEGLELLGQHTVDLVISDMRMPVMDGARFLEAVRLHDPGIVRILLTGYADISSTVAAINRGEIHRYISKPWDDQDMLLVVREALSRRALERHNAELVALTQAQNDQLKALNQTLEGRVAARTAELEQVNAMLTRSFADLDSNFTLALTVFSGLMEMRQDGIAGHSRRVAALSRAIGQRLDLNAQTLQDIYLAALLHDIGKIGFPDRMLGKPVSTYGPEELSRYRRHPQDGEAALMPLARLQGAARIIRQHHERLDGLGFPDGLSGLEITLGARIVTVVSDYDGLISGNLAERRCTGDMALQALRGGIDTHYDRRVVQALADVLAERRTDDDRSAADIEARELQPGMVLAQDLLTSQGAILLTAGHVFDERIVRLVGEFANRLGGRLTLKIRSDSIAVPMAVRTPAHQESTT